MTDNESRSLTVVFCVVAPGKPQSRRDHQTSAPAMPRPGEDH